MKIILLKIWKVLRNPYFISLTIFLLFYLFLGDNNRMLIIRLQRKVNDLQREATLLEESIVQDSLEAVQVIGSPEALEIYGREHYYMKRADEDIFIVKDVEEE